MFSNIYQVFIVEHQGGNIDLNGAVVDVVGENKSCVTGSVLAFLEK